MRSDALSIFSKDAAPLSTLARMCQLSVFLAGVLHMKSIFTEKMESVCLCLSACSSQARSGRGAAVEARGGARQALSACLRNFWPLSSVRGSREGGGEGGAGGELVADESQTPNPRLTLTA